jgi:hypothetical protein
MAVGHFDSENVQTFATLHTVFASFFWMLLSIVLLHSTTIMETLVAKWTAQQLQGLHPHYRS